MDLMPPGRSCGRGTHSGPLAGSHQQTGGSCTGGRSLRREREMFEHTHSVYCDEPRFEKYWLLLSLSHRPLHTMANSTHISEHFNCLALGTHFADGCTEEM